MTETGPLHESILTTVKKNLGIMESVTAFDPDLVILINGAFFKLHQMGVGPDVPFRIEDDSATWDDFCEEGTLDLVKPYIFLEVRMVFDPPTASVLSSMEKVKAEYEWRLNVADDQLLFKDDQNGTDPDE